MCASRQICFCDGLVLVMPFTGCATDVSGRHEEVAIRSNPPRAQVAVHNNYGEMVASGMTPAKVTLLRSRGISKRPPRYTATIQKPGYMSTQVEISPSFNPWTLGNIILGGPIGLVADTTSGAIWRMSPGSIEKDLPPLRGQMHAQDMPQTGEITPASYAGSHPAR